MTSQDEPRAPDAALAEESDIEQAPEVVAEVMTTATERVRRRAWMLLRQPPSQD
jgi:hypothetical protein